MNLLIGLIQVVILIFSAILHEISHGYVAERLGDPTARLMGRLTLNPKSHIDPIMSIILPLLLIISGSPVVFGAAKPVPIDPFNFRDGRKDVALVSIAGPITNVLIAITATLIFRILALTGIGLNSFLPSLFFIIVYINLILAIFNLIPIPPLDGSKVFALLLPEKQASIYLSLGSIGFLIIFFLLLFPIGGFSFGSLIFDLVNFSQKLLGF